MTDADVVLGRIDPARFAGGKIALDAGRAADAVLANVGAQLDMAAEEAARGIVEIVDETMASAARAGRRIRIRVPAPGELSRTTEPPWALRVL